MRKEIFILIAVIIGLSCSKETSETTISIDPVPKFTIIINSQDGGSVDNSGGTFQKNTAVSVTATPNKGYQFVGWSDGLTENPRVINLINDLTLIAQFSCIPLEISAVNSATSYHKKYYKPFDDYYKSIGADWSYILPARGYLNINNNDVPDQVIVSTKWPGNEKGALYLFIDNQLITQIPDFQTHSRKLLVSDFNNDGVDDVFVLDQGLDQSPDWGLGNNQKLVLFNQDGGYSIREFPSLGIIHGGAAGDIDNDGDIDVIAVNNRGPEYKFINDGNGNFQVQELFPGKDLQEYFTAELYDVNSDGNLDLIIGGHEWIKDDFPNKNSDFGGLYHNLIFYGNGTGEFDVNNPLVLPEVADWGTVVDFDFADLDFDGVDEIIINRAGGNKFAGMDNEGDMENGFYERFYIQILKRNGDSFVGYSNISSPDNWPKIHWLDWLDIYDLDGDCIPDIVPDDQEINYTQGVEFSQYRPGDLDGFKKLYFKGSGDGNFMMTFY